MTDTPPTSTVLWRGKPLELRVGTVVHLDGLPYRVEFKPECGGVVLASIKRPPGHRRMRP